MKIAPVVVGIPSSQPSRAVWWCCLIKGLSFKIKMIRDEHDLQTTAFRELNPRSLIPVLIDEDFVLYEMPAILCYLCEKNGWNDLYPSDLKQRSLVNQYLHAHHSTARLATAKLMAPHVTSAFNRPGAPQKSYEYFLKETVAALVNSKDKLKRGKADFSRIAEAIDKGWFVDRSPFLGGGSGPTIADIACYEELAQLVWANLFDFSLYGNIQKWLDAMRELPFHDVLHAYNFSLGDIATEPLTIERYVSAIQTGVEELVKVGVDITVFDGKGKQ